MSIAFVTTLFSLFNLFLVIGLFYLMFKFLLYGIRFFKSNIRQTEQKKILRKSLSENLKERRIRNNMTQEFVAEQLGVSRQAVSKWENGSAEPSTTNLIAIAKLYKTDVQDLLP